MCVPGILRKMRLILGSSTEMELELDLKGQRTNEGPWAETWLRATRGEYTLIVLCLGCSFHLRTIPLV